MAHRWYAEGSVCVTLRTYAYFGLINRLIQYPSTVARLLFKLGQSHGFAKIDNTLTSMGLSLPILVMVKNYLQYGKAFRVEGYDF